VVIPDRAPSHSTADPAYARRLQRLQGVWWKRLLPVQAPYRWHLRRLRLQRVLDIGCGNGRNLDHLSESGVGIDHNASLVEAARARGFVAYTPKEFRISEYARPAAFDSLLFAHVLEHMTFDNAAELVTEYLPYLRPGGRTVMITPQERGYASDPTHVEYMDFATIRLLSNRVGLRVASSYSFPFPRWMGRIFPYNEFVVIAAIPGPETS
jgi:2-polyprenyl-3-methyl-5-hydroxy-6-metoxy-1,4-benzoquinol methylase